MILGRPMSANIRALHLFEVAEAIDLGLLRAALGAQSRGREPAFRHPAPAYVRFEQSPVIQHLPTERVGTDVLANTRVRYFDYGVASVELRLSFEGSWEELIEFAHR